jgi:hypothetical protein
MDTLREAVERGRKWVAMGKATSLLDKVTDGEGEQAAEKILGVFDWLEGLLKDADAPDEQSRPERPDGVEVVYGWTVKVGDWIWSTVYAEGCFVEVTRSNRSSPPNEAIRRVEISPLGDPDEELRNSWESLLGDTDLVIRRTREPVPVPPTTYDQPQ